MWRVVLGVFAAGVAVIVLDQVFKDGGVEVEFLRENTLEAKLHQLVNNGAAESIAFGSVANVRTEHSRKAKLPTLVIPLAIWTERIEPL